MDAKVTINLAGLEAAKQAIAAGLSGSMSSAGLAGGQHIRNAFSQWAARYRGAMQERFDIFSKGGGDWKPLARSTIMARTRRPLARLRQSHAAGEIDEKTFLKRYKAAKGRINRSRRKSSKPVGMYGRMQMTASILRDTGTLFNTLSPTLGVAGQYEEHVPFGIQVGIGGPVGHPSGRATIAEIAGYHQFGGGGLPKREILVLPSDDVTNAMVSDMERAIARTFRDLRQGDSIG